MGPFGEPLPAAGKVVATLPRLAQPAKLGDNTKAMPTHRFFLAKSEPDVYSISDLKRDGTTTWDGVRNAQARQAMQRMRPGDIIFIYHSGGVSAVVGVAKVITEPVDDPGGDKMTLVDVEFVHELSEPVTLKDVKASEQFADFALVRQSRLSTMEAPLKFVSWLKKQRPELKKVL
jgi:predicted RNA-binding protein with PUA-like domain